MTEALATRALPAPRSGGAVRRFVLRLVSVLVWAASLWVLGIGASPGLGEPTEKEWSVRVALVALGLLLAALPWLLIGLPAQRKVEALLGAVLAVAADHRPPALPPFEAWSGPERMFRRLQLGSYSLVAIPLLLLLGTSVAFAVVVGEPLAAAVFAALALVPLLFAVVTWTLPRRLRAGVRSGADRSQAVGVTLAGRVDLKQLVGDAWQSWFDAVLPDGQHVTLRTPWHFSWAAPARGVLDGPGLVLVLGNRGHQGLLLHPGRPADAVWLLGPVPLVRVPRGVQRALAADSGSR